MNCDYISRLLSEGKPLDGPARKHLAGCNTCRLLAEARFVPPETLDLARLEQFKRIATDQLTAVRPLASDRQLTFLLVTLFFCFTIATAFPSGSHGLRVLTLPQMTLYYGVIVLSALFGASALVQEMIPGARRYLDAKAALLAEAAALIVTVAILFRSLSVARFVASGHSCLLLGLSCMAGSGLLFSFVLKDGWFISPVRAGVVAGFFSGLTGVAVLAIHCSLLSIPHILVWHFGVLPLGMVLGATIGYIASKLQRKA